MYGAKPPGRNIYVRNSGVQILHHHDQLNYHQPTARCVCWVQAKRLDDAMPSYDQNTQRHPKLSVQPFGLRRTLLEIGFWSPSKAHSHTTSVSIESIFASLSPSKAPRQAYITPDVDNTLRPLPCLFH